MVMMHMCMQDAPLPHDQPPAGAFSVAPAQALLSGQRLTCVEFSDVHLIRQAHLPLAREHN